MQTRMARKLPNGNYLVPHLLAFKVKEYKPDGTVVNEIKLTSPNLAAVLPRIGRLPQSACPRQYGCQSNARQQDGGV
ncbi:MAG: hypothetical protein Ct9H300mP7_6940 [Verrucomicrobiota bacterium]|nr:MAG: hypothetical protein Ct9H300mP7_6940 [Verrucomicrobiota bacterium]